MYEALVYKETIFAADTEVRNACDRIVTCSETSGKHNEETTSTVMKTHISYRLLFHKDNDGRLTAIRSKNTREMTSPHSGKSMVVEYRVEPSCVETTMIKSIKSIA